MRQRRWGQFTGVPVTLWLALLALLGACTFMPGELGDNRATATAAVEAGVARAYRAGNTMVGGSVARGEVALQKYGCGSCHSIPGVAGANSWVGPPLDNWAERQIIVGTYPNEPQHLMRWIRFPQAVEPGNAMPDMGVTEQDARDISAYLYSLTRD